MGKPKSDELLPESVKIGVSACLLGRKVRFDGGHKRNRFITDSLAGHLVRVLSDLSRAPLSDIADSYIARLMQALTKPATRKRHTNMLQHLLGYSKRDLDSDHRTDLSETIDAYRRGEFPLVVPIPLLQHHFSMHPHPYIKDQVYLLPHPQALMLRNTL